MKTQQSDTHDLRMERRLEAPVERVWEALTARDWIPRWYGPGNDFEIEVLEWECRVGGGYRVAMHAGEETHTCYGTFRTVEPRRRVAYTWAWEGQPPMDTLVTFQIQPDGDSTQLIFTHEGFPAEEAREQHQQGWTGSLEQLAAAVG
ncbi:MAG: SRPBCC domain-containing protein [Gemmatimonadota bacterium]